LLRVGNVVKLSSWAVIGLEEGMPEKKEESSEFKVVDRRGFNSEGARREEPEPDAVKQTAGPSPLDESPAEEPLVGEGDREDFGPPGFDTILSYLSTTALFQLGLLPGPGGERIPPDLVNGRRTIDMLEVLQQKTRGNLTAPEAQMLENILYELRLSYVEIQKYLTKPSP
jgi:hypothetical protein